MRRARRGAAGGWLLWPLIALLVAAPLPLGSNRPIPWTLLALASALLLLAWSTLSVVRPTRRAVRPVRLWPALSGLAVVVLVALLQMAPYLPRSWHHPLWLQAAGVLGDQAVVGRISVDPDATGTALMLLLTNAAVFWLALQLSRQPQGARRIIQAIAIAGLAYAVYGLIVFLLELNMVLWWRRWTWMTGLTSSFVNRNTYATYAGLGLLCAVGLLVTTVYRDLRSRRLRRLPWRTRLMRITWQGWWVAGAVLCLAFALILTRSRGGVASSAVALSVLIGCFGATRLMRWRDVLVSGGAALALAVGVFVLGGDDLAARFERQGIASPRYEGFQRIAQAIGEAPWLGTGYGTFPDLFRGYQQRVSDEFWNHAHNTYLENAFELGIPAAAALVAAIGWLALACARSLSERRRSALYPCLGVAATVLVGLHALLDFSLEIPAVAVAYAAILGVAFGRARGAPTAVRRRVAKNRRPRGRAGVALGAVVATAILALAVPRLAAELTGLPARLVERQLDTAAALPPGALDRAIAAARAAAAWADADDHWARVARAELALAATPGLLPNARRSRLARADEAWRKALAAAPADPVDWARLGYVTVLRGGAPATASGALALSVVTGPNEGGLMAFRSAVAATAWHQLDQRCRGLFASQFVKTMAFAPAPFVDAIRRTAGVAVVRAELEDQPRLQQELDRLLLVMGQH